MKKDLFIKIVKWQKNTFGEATALSKLNHLEEEVQELIHDVTTQSPSTRLEFADCFLLLFGAADAYGMTYEDIQQAIEEKHLINLNRKWGKPDDKGVVKHIK